MCALFSGKCIPVSMHLCVFEICRRAFEEEYFFLSFGTKGSSDVVKGSGGVDSHRAPLILAPSSLTNKPYRVSFDCSSTFTCFHDALLL